MEFLIFIVWLLLSFAAGLYAARLHRSDKGWALLAIALSPLIAFVFLFALGDARQQR
jgi:hypothetical protein